MSSNITDRTLRGSAEKTEFPVLSMQELLDLGYVAPLPAIARNRIKERYRCSIGPYGRDCDGMTQIRQTIATIDKDGRFKNALFLTAIHTHWGGSRIIESFDSESGQYVVGPKDISDTEVLRPYSFAFSHRGPLPVEWFDESVPIDESELQEAYSFIWRLNNAVASQLNCQLPIPIGLMIDHRFKASLWDGRMHSFIEGDSQKGGSRSYVHPVFESVVNPSPLVPGTIRVAWSSYPDEDFPQYPLSERERSFFLAFESKMSAQEPFKAKAFVDGLEHVLSG